MRSRLIPPMARDLIQSALSMADGARFTAAPSCPACGGPVRGYDTTKKRFATVCENGIERSIFVHVKRFTCRNCTAICHADEPFYPGTRVGSPVIDLCTTFATTMPFSRVAAILETMGVLVDRGSCRNYSRMQLPVIPCVDVFGIRLPFSIVSLASLPTRFGDAQPVPGTEILAACNFPSAYRAPPEDGGPDWGRKGRDEEEAEGQAG